MSLFIFHDGVGGGIRIPREEEREAKQLEGNENDNSEVKKQEKNRWREREREDEEEEAGLNDGGYGFARKWRTDVVSGEKLGTREKINKLKKYLNLYFIFYFLITLLYYNNFIIYLFSIIKYILI